MANGYRNIFGAQMKYFPGVTNEIREAALEMSEIKAFDITNAKAAERRRYIIELQKAQKKRTKCLESSSRLPTRKLQHTKS